MRFSQVDVFRATGLTKDTWRHWKTVLPAFADRDGRSVRFTPAEALTVAALAEACATLHLQISFIKPFAQEFFKAVAEAVDGGLPLGHLHVSANGVIRSRTGQAASDGNVVLIIDLTRIARRLAGQLPLWTDPVASPQLTLPL